MTERSSTRESSGRGLLLVAVVMAVAIAVTGYMGYSAVREVAGAAVIGQADALMRALRLERPRGLPTGELLQQFLDANSDLGLTYVMVATSPEEVAVEAGVPIDRHWVVPPPREGRALTRHGDRFRLVTPLVGRMIRMREGSIEVEVRERRMGRDRPGSRERDRGFIVMEFEPKPITRLLFNSTLLMVGGLAASVLLVGAALWLHNLSARVQQSRMDLEKQRGLAKLGEMSAVLAHEIKNPLGAMKGNVQLLLEELEAGSRAAEKARRILGDTVRLQELTSDLLDYVRSEKVNFSLSDPADILLRAAGEAQGDLAAGEVSVDTADAPRHWLLDATKVSGALANLISNALSATRELAGEAEPHDEEASGATVEAAAYLRRGMLVFTVADRGPGVAGDTEERERIFEPFHTTRTDGVGLGLAVARKVARAHGGELTVRNRDGGGAVFEMTLPPGSADGGNAAGSGEGRS